MRTTCEMTLKGIVAGALLFVLAAMAFGQDVPLELKGDGVKVVKVDKIIVVKEDRTVVASFPFTVAAPAGSGLYFWAFPATVQAVDKGDKLDVLNAPKGALTISLKAIEAKLDKDGKFLGFQTKFGSVTFDVGDVTPAPKPDTPKPDPPKPDTTAPIPDAGLRVLIIYESGETTPQLDNIISGNLVRDYMDAKGAKDAINGAAKPAFRAYDKDSVGELPWIVNAMKRNRTSLPWLIVSNPGKGGYEGPLPGTAQGTLDIIKKFGE